MENVMTVTFKDSDTVYKVLSELKNSRTYNVLTAGIISKENGQIVTKDGFNKDDFNSNWAKGGLMGGFIGLLMGPMGMLLGSSLGMLTGSMRDLDNASEKVDIFNHVASGIENDETVLVMIAQEEGTFALDQYLFHNGAKEIQRENVDSVQTTILMAQETERELQREAREKLRHQKREDFKERVDEEKNKIKQRFSRINSDKND